jgi:hypothetical protein
MHKLIKSFDILGSDDVYYEVQLLERPGKVLQTMKGPARTVRGLREYLLADGRQLIDISNSEWEILNTNVRLPKPDDEDEA